jgi:hypothetical protein
MIEVYHMKKLLAAVLALTMAFSMSACAKSNEETKNETKGEEQTSPVDEGLVTVYQRVSETEYKADGTKGHTQKRYTYDDHNNLLAIETDNGPYQEVDMGGFMVKVPLAFDGTIENSSYFLYTDDGRLMVNNFYNGPVIENGKLIETVISRNGECYYTYLSDGRINTCEQYVIGLDGPLLPGGLI